MKKNTITILIIILLLTAGGYLYSNKKRVNNIDNEKENTAVVEKIDINESIEVSGNISPIKTKNLQLLNQGRIEAIYVKEGDSVLKDEIICQLEYDDIELLIAQKKYEIEQEKRSGSARNAELKEMELAGLTKSLKERTVQAPFDGIIGKIFLKEGDVYNPGTDIISIFNIDSLVANVHIDELDIPLAEIGQKVLFQFDAIPNSNYEGYLSNLAPLGIINNWGIAAREAELKIDNPSSEIFTPYSFTAQIIISEPVPTLVLNEKALIREEDRIYVQTDLEGYQREEIRIKPYKTGKIIVLSGLNEGDIVYIPEAAPIEAGKGGIFDEE